MIVLSDYVCPFSALFIGWGFVTVSLHMNFLGHIFFLLAKEMFGLTVHQPAGVLAAEL